eukprot:13774675-Ditylum_brightwellii.AAC.1
MPGYMEIPSQILLCTRYTQVSILRENGPPLLLTPQDNITLIKAPQVYLNCEMACSTYANKCFGTSTDSKLLTRVLLSYLTQQYFALSRSLAS